MNHAKRYYKKSVMGAVVVHIVLLILLIFSLRMPSVSIPAETQTTEIVNAVSVDQNKVQQEMQRIQAENQAKQRAEAAKQKALAQKAEEIKRERVAQEKKIAELKAQQKKLAEQKQAVEQATQKQAALLKAIQHEKSEKNAPNQEPVKKNDAHPTPDASPAKPVKVSPMQPVPSAEEQALQKQLADEEAKLNATMSRQLATEVDKYKALILNAIGQQWIIPPGVDKNLSTILSIRLAPDGTVLSVEVLKASGNPALDRSAMAAVRKASPLPVPKDVITFSQFRELHLTVKPEESLNVLSQLT